MNDFHAETLSKRYFLPRTQLFVATLEPRVSSTQKARFTLLHVWRTTVLWTSVPGWSK